MNRTEIVAIFDKVFVPALYTRISERISEKLKHIISEIAPDIITEETTKALRQLKFCSLTTGDDEVTLTIKYE